jgi:hypothetical protein
MKGAAVRFPGTMQPKQPQRHAAAGELLRRFLSPAALQPCAEPAPVRPEELPVDLDQRVRLVGEW